MNQRYEYQLGIHRLPRWEQDLRNTGTGSGVNSRIHRLPRNQRYECHLDIPWYKCHLGIPRKSNLPRVEIGYWKIGDWNPGIKESTV
jgi:hypothetical protein